MESGGIPIARVLGRCVLLGAILLLVAISLEPPAARADVPAPSPTDVSVTVDTLPSGIPVAVDGTPHDTPYTFVCVQNSTHVATVTNTYISGDTQYVFTNWTDGQQAPSHPFVCDAVQNLTAVYRTEYWVFIDTFPANALLQVDGNFGFAPFEGWCAEGSARHAEALSPQDFNTDTRRFFVNWSDGGAATHNIRCDGPRRVLASFRSEYRITVSTTPTDLVITVDGSPFRSPHDFWCEDGATHMIGILGGQAQPDGQWAFSGWSDGGAESHGIACSRPSAFVASFILVTPPSTATSTTYIWVYVVAIIVLVVVFIVVVAVLIARSSRRGRAAVMMPPPIPGGVPADVARTPYGPPQVCPQCGHPCEGDWTYCPTCGATLHP